MKIMVCFYEYDPEIIFQIKKMLENNKSYYEKFYFKYFTNKYEISLNDVDFKEKNTNF